MRAFFVGLVAAGILALAAPQTPAPAAADVGSHVMVRRTPTPVPTLTLEQLIRTHFGTVCTDLNWDPRADQNGDCIVNALDYSIWRATATALVGWTPTSVGTPVS